MVVFIVMLAYQRVTSFKESENVERVLTLANRNSPVSDAIHLKIHSYNEKPLVLFVRVDISHGLKWSFP